MDSKHLILVLAILLCMPIVFAKIERVTLEINESVLVADKNITLLKTNWDNKKAVLCINNNRHIIADTFTMGSGYVEVSDIESGSVRLKIKAECDNCICTGDCLNLNCFSSPNKDTLVNDSDLHDIDEFILKADETLKENKKDALEEEQKSGVDVQEEGKIGISAYKKAFFFLIVLTLLSTIVLVLKKKVK